MPMFINTLRRFDCRIKFSFFFAELIGWNELSRNTIFITNDEVHCIKVFNLTKC
jgi:hypothetical protein